MRLINNTYSNRTVFKADFIDEENLISKSIEKTSDYDLYKFSKTLERMSKIDDSKIFSLHHISYRNPLVKQQDIRLEINDNYKQIKSKLVARETVNDNKNFTDNIFNNLIFETNKILTKLYPEPKLTNAKRENSINRINKFIKNF